MDVGDFNSSQWENSKFNDYSSEINGQSQTLNSFIVKIRPVNKYRTGPIKLTIKKRVKYINKKKKKTAFPQLFVT